VSPLELPTLAPGAPAPVVASPPRHDAVWQRTARQARLLSWLSLAWMTVEGVVGLVAGLDARALSVVVWAASSFVEGLASVIVIWRFTGARTMSDRSERLAQRLVAGSFLLLVPFFVYEAINRLIVGSDTTSSVLGIAVTASAIVLMPGLGWAKLKLGRRLSSAATAGEGIQNLMCAAQAAAALGALLAASAGVGVLDPVAALIIAALAARESISMWQGDSEDCCAPIGFTGTQPQPRCCDSDCDRRGDRQSAPVPASASRVKRDDP
jgi:divalent metal cation (Fe/Co/Zn/Cd) transporter